MISTRSSPTSEPEPDLKQPFSIAVHGGAGRIPAAARRGAGKRAYEQALTTALGAGAAVLKRGGSAVRAVCAAVTALEDDELFNAGRGAVLCQDGSVELSASVMNGRTLAVGAVVGVSRTRNPVLAAQALLDHSHCLLFGARGDAFAEARHLAMVAPEYFVTPQRRQQWERRVDRSEHTLDHDGGVGDAHGTVGAVARDRRGHLAAATSTGGLVNQLPGRVGDSPVAGAGTWANAHCAVSATGTGDAFFRVAFARRVADLVELAGATPLAAAERALGEVRAVKGQGGCILIAADGRIATAMNSPQMIRGSLVEGESPRLGIGAGDDA
jgi:beta-aspartyl-peptidase (threonine type)